MDLPKTLEPMGLNGYSLEEFSKEHPGSAASVYKVCA
jgi:hypothetical protein